MSSKSPITTHVLDATTGLPGKGIAVQLFSHTGGDPDTGWRCIAEGTTDSDGRHNTLLETHQALGEGLYKLRFATGDYFSAQHRPVFYPTVEVQFMVTAERHHYHIPLLLSPYSYSTYRGS